jgi:hypothetical protein
MTEVKRRRLAAAFSKLRRGGTKVELWAHEADALYEEFCRLANFATLLGEPSPAEMAGILTREKAEERAAQRERLEADRILASTPARAIPEREEGRECS